MLKIKEPVSSSGGFFHPARFRLIKLKTMQRDDEKKTNGTSVMRVVFGIIMIIIYVGMGVLLLINFFDWGPGIQQWLRWIGGIAFIVYGIWRAIRQFWGIDSSL